MITERESIAFEVFVGDDGVVGVVDGEVVEIEGGVLIMDRYVVVDADGYAVNVVLWDGETPFDADGELELESECKAKAREIVDEQSAQPE